MAARGQLALVLLSLLATVALGADFGHDAASDKIVPGQAHIFL